jgi:4-amino-4-deoxy-L-arabinose transferase-like glycosyltransferase
MVFMTRAFAQLFRPRLAVAIIVAVALAVTVDTYRSISHTWDEPAHIANGLMMLDSGRYIEYQHPPLARVATAIGPFLGGSRSEGPKVLPVEFVDRILDSFDEGRRILYQTGGSYDRVLTLSRLGILPFLVLVLLATYEWARRMLGEWPAVLAVFYLASTPIILGNAGISTLDLPLTALAIPSLALYCNWLERPTLVNGSVLGAVTGAAIMSKFSAIPFLGLCFATIALWYAWRGFNVDDMPKSSGLVAAARQRLLMFASHRHVVSAAAAFGMLILVFWIAYGWGFVSLADPSDRPYARVDQMFAPGSTANRLVSDALELKIIPKFVYGIKEGVKDLGHHNATGHLSYLLGERGEQGWWYYYLVGLAIRTPLPLLIAGLIGLALLSRKSLHEGSWLLGVPAVAFLTLLAFVCAYSKINLGIRHILVLYPLLSIGAAYVTVSLLDSSRRHALATALVVLLIGSQVASVAVTHPDHVSYFNAIVGSTPERFLITADLDWGQDMKRLETELKRRQIDKVAVSFYGSNDLSRHALPGYSPLQPNTHQNGWIAISIWRLYRNEDFSWLRSYKPVARVGTSVNLYYIDDSAPSGHQSKRTGS